MGIVEWWLRRREAKRRARACVICGVTKGTTPIPVSGARPTGFASWPPPGSIWTCSAEHLGLWFDRRR